MSQTYFIAGITGKVGSVAAKHLLKQGHRVRSLVRNHEKAEQWKQQGVETLIGDLTDLDVLKQAVHGSNAAFILIPPMLPEQAVQNIIKNYQTVLSDPIVSLRRVVVLSSMGSEQTEKLGLIKATSLLERALAEVKIPIAFIRAGSFYENILPQLPQIQQTGRLDSFYTPAEKQIPYNGTVDIGNLVAELLTSTQWSQQKCIIELGTMLSLHDVAAELSAVFGRPVTAHSISREHWPAVLQQMGLPPSVADGYVEMMESVNNGHIHHGVPGTERVQAKTPARVVYQQFVQRSA